MWAFLKLAVKYNPNPQITTQGPRQEENQDFDQAFEHFRKFGADMAVRTFFPTQGAQGASGYNRRAEDQDRQNSIDVGFRALDRAQNVIPRGEESVSGVIGGDSKVGAAIVDSPASTWEYAPKVKETRGKPWDDRNTMNGIERAFHDNETFDWTSQVPEPGVIHRAVG